ncbi:MAG: excinuclease ABC subunit UvrA, partial [Planctomycetota bacterium]
AFDTIFAEGQRQFVESLSLPSRRFLNQLPRPEVSRISGLQPTICLDQSHRLSNRRTTVGTISEVYDYLRLLFSKAGIVRCDRCGQSIQQTSPQQIQKWLLSLPERTKLMILAPMSSTDSGDHRDVIQKVRRERLVRVVIDEKIFDIDQTPPLEPGKEYRIQAVTDRIIIKPGIESRVLEAIETAVKISKLGGVDCSFLLPSDNGQTKQWQTESFGTAFACTKCEVIYPEVEPKTFSFNSPFGACKDCTGLGVQIQFDVDKVVDRSKALTKGAVKAWLSLTPAAIKKNVASLIPVMDALGFDHDRPLDEMSESQWESFLNSSQKKCLGLFTLLEKEMATTPSDQRFEDLETMKSGQRCKTCAGSRLSSLGSSVFVDRWNLPKIVDTPIDQLTGILNQIEFESEWVPVVEPILNAITHRIEFLQKVGLGYLTMGRGANTLSGGEHQRVRLAASIGSGLTSACFVLDEPSIGLHEHDGQKLISTLRELQQAGNSLIVVEHDEKIIQQADWVVDIGPAAGQNGGQVIAAGPPNEIMDCPESVTGKFLARDGTRILDAPAKRRIPATGSSIQIVKASGNNLRDLNVEIPLGVFCCVTGVSGSGKSTLINQTLVPAIKQKLGFLSAKPEPFEKIQGLEKIEFLKVVDQKPLGRSPRACPATHLGIFDLIRKLFAATRESKQLGYPASRFSFNVKSGRCDDCKGWGVKKVPMDFMPDVMVGCETCGGKRYNFQTLRVKFAGLNIGQVLDLPVVEAMEFFDGFDSIRKPLEKMQEVGLGYLKLGQPSTTLSGGEAQRIKLAT